MLPTGRWNAKFFFDVDEDCHGQIFTVEVHAAELLGKLRVCPQGTGSFEAAVPVEVTNPRAPIEIRVMMDSGAIEGRLRPGVSNGCARRDALSPGSRRSSARCRDYRPIVLFRTVICCADDLTGGVFPRHECDFVAEHFYCREFCKPTFPAREIPYWRRKTRLFMELIVRIRVEKRNEAHDCYRRTGYFNRR